MHSTTNFTFSFLNCGIIISIFFLFNLFSEWLSSHFYFFLYFSFLNCCLLSYISVLNCCFLFLFFFRIAVSYFYFFSELRSFYFTSAQPEKLTVRDTLDECPKKKTLQKPKKTWKSFILFPQISLLLRLVNHNWHLIMMSRWQTS